MPQLANFRSDIEKATNPEKAKLLQCFFKTGKGEYGEGDIFLGITVPESRKLAIKYKDLPLKDTESLLKSKIHEERLIALLILVHNYEKNSETRDKIFNFYLKNTEYINNWDLVDLSSHQIVGNYLSGRNRYILHKLAKSDNLWEKRISIISTAYFIKKDDFSETLKIATILLKDKHDLIHKAVGWMLREVGKRDLKTEESFLKKNYKKMPRTMLRYAIEKFPESKRLRYLKGEI